MKFKDLHTWERINQAEARNIQEELRSRIILEDMISASDIRRVAGIDNAYVKDGQVTIAHAPKDMHTSVVSDWPPIWDWFWIDPQLAAQSPACWENIMNRVRHSVLSAF